jgi:hypothetical protein
MSLGQLNRLVQLTAESENPVKAMQLRSEEPATEEVPTT